MSKKVPGQVARPGTAAGLTTVRSRPQQVSELVIVDPRTDQDWQQLVLTENSHLFQSPEWIRAVAQTYPFEVKACILKGNSGPTAGLAYAKLDGLHGPRVVAFPFSDYSDPILSSDDDWQILSDGVLDEGMPTTIRCLHNKIPLGDNRFKVTRTALWHAIDLQPDGGDMWAQLEPSARRAVRKSRAAQVEVSHAQSAEELRAFYDLHLGTRKRKYRLFAQPYSFFENLWREFVEKDKGTLMLARVNGEVAAGVMFLEFKDTLYYKFNASDQRFLNSRPNDALLWTGIEYGRMRGLRSMDFGLSDGDQEGLVRYKRKYATAEKTISFLEHSPERMAVAEASELAQLLPTLTRLLTDEQVPDEITEQAGAILYHYFA